eukprot:TRINITY_DN4589_c0_g1_i5.p2 TRINITY_DN4589_c0_g1~~TRINITY_DN4589_c0_g1_i5.p2  ORF type:complete len:306 (-),score=71.74 TRINITY_DN4589_c0_g1_i5:757-1674(-)
MSVISIEGRRLLVNGERTFIKGINYTPTPIGQGPGDSDLFANASLFERDLPLIKEMGCNAIRIYNLREPHNYDKYKPFLDCCMNHSIFVAVGLWVPYNQDFSDSKVREEQVAKFSGMVDALKEHPAILMWLFGNEVNHHTKDLDAFLQTVQECRFAVKEIEASAGVSHPVASPLGDTRSLEDIMKNHEDAVDLWCVQLYRGRTFGKFWKQVESASEKPCLVTEFGCDSFDNGKGQEDQETQAAFDVKLYEELVEHRELCAGGFVFGYMDQFWKGGSKHKQLTGGHKSNGPGGYANEAYFGVCVLS